MTSALSSRPARATAIAGSALVAGALVVGAAGTASAAPVTGSGSAAAAPTAAAASTTLTAKKSKLTAAQLAAVGANSTSPKKTPTSVTAPLKANAFRYSYQDPSKAYLLLATGAETGPTFKVLKKDFAKVTGTTKVTSLKINNKSKTGIIKVSDTITVPVNMPDGSTRDVTGFMYGVGHIDNKTSVMAASVYIPEFGGSKAAAQKSANKAALILAKNYGMKV